MYYLFEKSRLSNKYTAMEKKMLVALIRDFLKNYELYEPLRKEVEAGIRADFEKAFKKKKNKGKKKARLKSPGCRNLSAKNL